MGCDSQAKIYSTYYDNIDQILKDLENEGQFKQLHRFNLF